MVATNICNNKYEETSIKIKSAYNKQSFWQPKKVCGQSMSRNAEEKLTWLAIKIDL